MDSLAEYVQRRAAAGLSRAEIKEELLALGWSEQEADIAYRDGLVALGAPLPSSGNRPALTKKSSTVDVAINFFSFILLCIVATSLGTLYFQVINNYFPGPLAALGTVGELGAMRAMHYAIASLVIAFPLYFLSLRLWFRKFQEDEGRTESRLTRWLTYLVLLAASITIVGDFIAVLFRFLQGEGSARFFLKALIILVVATFIFGFYYFERRRIQYHRSVPRVAFSYLGASAASVVALGIVLGFVAAGSPATARKLAFDAMRARELNQLSNCIGRYARALGQLPSSLAELRRSGGYTYCAAFMDDPDTKAQYEYRVIVASRVQGSATIGEFELCATFSLPSGKQSSAFAGAWDKHDAGRSCHTSTAQLVGKAAPSRPAK